MIIDHSWRVDKTNKTRKLKLTKVDCSTKLGIKRYITCNFHSTVPKNNYELESIRLNLKKQDYRLVIKKDFINEFTPIEYRLIRYFNKKKWKGKLTLDNYLKDTTSCRGKVDFHLENGKKISLAGSLSYKSKTDIWERSFKFSTLIPFQIRRSPSHSQKVKGKVIVNDHQPASNIILSVNGRKVKTNKKGKFNCSVGNKKNVVINVVDLGDYQADYLLKQSLPIFIKKYRGELLKLDLIRYSTLKLKFKTPIKRTNKYLKGLQSDKKERALIKLYNKHNYFIKEYQGEKTIRFKKIPPGEYKLIIDNKEGRYLYHINSRKFKIKSGQKTIKIKKTYLGQSQIKLDEKPENLKIED